MFHYRGGNGKLKKGGGGGRYTAVRLYISTRFSCFVLRTIPYDNKIFKNKSKMNVLFYFYSFFYDRRLEIHIQIPAHMYVCMYIHTYVNTYTH